MKKALLLFVLAVAFQAPVLAETYTINPQASEIGWHATKVTGEHYGRVGVASGTIEFEGDTFTGGSATVNMTSIGVEDIKDPGNNQKLTNHLKSADFFDVEKFPEATLEVTDVRPAEGNTYNVTADLTIKGITHPVSFPARVVKTPDGVQADATIRLDRTLYDVRYGSGKFFDNLGDRMIHDEFTLDISIEAEQA